MGLDMYLTKKIYVGAHYEHRQITGKINIFTNGEKIDVDLNKVNEISERVYYWRKCNAIHQFFVDRVQDGEDDCKEYYIDYDVLLLLFQYIREDLEYLDSLEKDYKSEDKSYYIFKDLDAEALNLIPKSGFFFGSTEIDSYFYNDLKNTLEELEPLIDSNSKYYYSSSW